jgi:hypothetical protein
VRVWAREGSATAQDGWSRNRRICGCSKGEYVQGVPCGWTGRDVGHVKGLEDEAWATVMQRRGRVDAHFRRKWQRPENAAMGHRRAGFVRMPVTRRGVRFQILLLLTMSWNLPAIASYFIYRFVGDRTNF